MSSFVIQETTLEFRRSQTKILKESVTAEKRLPVLCPEKGDARVASPEVTSKRSRFQDTMKPLLASERPVTVPVCQHWRKLNLKCAYGEKCHKRHNIWTKNPSNQDNEEEVEPGPSTSQKITRTSSGSVYDRLGESTRSVHDRLGPTPPKKDKMSSNQSKPSIHERLSQ